MGGVIALNSLQMGMQTDIAEWATLWWWSEQFFMVIYAFELTVRLKHDGTHRFFCDEDEWFWNWMDFAIVVCGVADQWCVPLFQNPALYQSKNSQSKYVEHIMMIMRMLRLMRILRLLKLVRAVRPLFLLSIGIVKALQSTIWVLVLVFVALYAFAILTTRMIGQGMIVENPEDLPADVQALFATIPESMFTLFGIMNGKDWHRIAPFLEYLPWMQPFFVLFTVFASWALLSVMTGVVSDNMVAVREMEDSKNAEQRTATEEAVHKALREMFTYADLDANGVLQREEYRHLLKSRKGSRLLEKISSVSKQDLSEMFDWLDVDHSGVLEFDEFVHGFQFLNEPVSGLSIFKLIVDVRVKTAQLCQLAETATVNIEGKIAQLRFQQQQQYSDLAQMITGKRPPSKRKTTRTQSLTKSPEHRSTDDNKRKMQSQWSMNRAPSGGNRNTCPG